LSQAAKPQSKPQGQGGPRGRPVVYGRGVPGAASDKPVLEEDQ